MKEKKLKRYWFTDWRNDKDYVTSAYSIKYLKEKVGTDRIYICKVYYNKKNLKEDDLILLY